MKGGSCSCLSEKGSSKTFSVDSIDTTCDGGLGNVELRDVQDGPAAPVIPQAARYPCELVGGWNDAARATVVHWKGVATPGANRTRRSS